MPRVAEQRCLFFSSSLANKLIAKEWLKRMPKDRCFNKLNRIVGSITARAHLFRGCQRSLDVAEGGGAPLQRKLLLDLRRVT
jgi:hypothetical protein